MESAEKLKSFHKKQKQWIVTPFKPIAEIED